MEQIFIYIIVFALLIASSVKKKKKQAQQQQAKNVEKDVIQNEEESKVQDFFKQLQEQLFDIPTEKKVQNIPPEVIDDPIISQNKRGRERKATASKVYLDSKANAKYSKQQKNVIVSEVEDEVVENLDIQIVDVNDARRAFIFSEIWNRKYV